MAQATFRQEQGLTVVELAGRIDAESAAAVREAIWAQLGEVPILVIDGGRVDFLSSAGLRVFIALHHHVTSRRGRLALANFPKQVHEIFKVTGLDQYLPTARTLDEGIRKLRA